MSSVSQHGLSRGRDDQDTFTYIANNLMPAPFLGKPIEICIVTYDAAQAMAGLVSLGIGPFKVFHFAPSNVREQTYRGKAAAFSLKVCFAEQQGMVWEIMEPLSGPSIIVDYLSTKGSGIHHIAFDGADRPVVERIAEFERRGYARAQSGIWQGKRGTCHFNFFDTDGAIGTCFETYEFSADWEEPDEVEYFPPVKH